MMAISGVQSNTTNVYNPVTGTTTTTSYDPKALASLYTALVKGAVPDATSPGQGSGGSPSALDATRSTNTTGVSDQTLSQLEAAMQTIAQLFANPSNSIDAVAQALVELQGRQSAESAQESLNDANNAVQQSLAQADTLRQEGNALIAGAASQLIMSVASAAVSIGGGMKQIGILTGGGAGAEALAAAYGQVLGGITKFADGLGGLANSIAQQQSKLDEAQGAEDQAAAQQKNSMSQYKQKIGDDLKQLVDQITQLVAALMQNKAALAQAIAG